MSDRARRTILERRAAFIAAAVASIGASAGCDPRANACLSAVADESAKHVTPADVGVPDTSPRVCLTESPEPCLSPPPMPTDAGAKPIPMPCLSVKMPRDAGPKPKTCLTPLPDD